MKKSALRSAWLAALLGCGVLMWAPPMACAQRKKDAPPAIPPPAQPLSVKVPRGESLPILLRIYGRKNEALKYLIRTPPQHGRLTAPRVVEMEVSTVTYTPPADLAIVRDRFTYAVQNSAGVSAAVDVLITIVDVPPEITVPEVLNFPSILVGGIATQTLEITNRGGGVAEGRVTVDEPWKIDGSANYRLAAGARGVFKVLFAPSEPGVFDTVMRFSSQPGTTVPVHAEAQAALTAAPANVVHRHAAGDPVRAGTFEITNHTDAELRATLSGGDRLTVPAELAVAARGTAEVTVQTAGGDLAAIEGEVAVRSAGSRLRVPVRAAAVGAIVRATRERLPLGRVRATQSAEGQVGLENIGGTAARVSWEIAAPFVAEGSPVTLGAGEKATVTVRIRPGAVAKHRASLIVAADQQKLEIPVEVELLAAGPAPPPRATEAVSAPKPHPDLSGPAPAPPAREITLAIPEELRVDLTPAPGVLVRDVTAGGATLQWPATLTRASQFRIECRNVFVDPVGQLAVRWTPLSSVTFGQEGESRIATITGLEPATGYGFRVVAEGSPPETGTVLFMQYFSTRSQPDFWPKITLLRVLIFGLAICIGIVFRQRRAARRRS